MSSEEMQTITLEDLIQQYQDGDGSVIETLWMRLEPYYQKKAAQFYLRHSYKCKKAGIEVDDLVYSAGFPAMLESIITFDLSQGVPAKMFLHYALRTEYAKLIGYRSSSQDALNNAVELDAPIPDSEDLTAADLIEDEQSLDFLRMDDMYDDCTVIRQEVCRVLSDQRQLDAIQRYYFNGETLQAIADSSGVSSEMIRQRKKAAERKLYDSPLLFQLYKEFTGLRYMQKMQRQRWRNAVI